MATKLYFHNASNALSGTFPAGEQSARTANNTASGANTLRTMDRTIGTGQVTVDIQFDASINVTYNNFFRFFCSPPLASDQTVGGGSITLNAADSKDAASQDHWIDSLNVYVWRPSTGALVGTIKDANSLGGTEPTATDSEQVTHITGITSSAVSALAGDVVICEIWSQAFSGANRVSANHRFYYDGTTENTTENAVVSNHASFIQLAEDLVFEGEGGPTLVSASDTLTPSLTESLAVLVVAGLADTLTPSVNDAAALLTSLGIADTLTPSLTDAAALAAAVSLVDTLTPGLAEVAAVLAAVAVAETLTPSLAESASVAGSVTPVSLSDTLTPSLTESTALVALLGLTDALTPAVAEALQAAGAVALVDALTPSLGAALSTLTAVAVADVATPSLTDAAAVLVAQALADTLTPALAESAGVADIKALTDTLTPSLIEALTVVASAIAAGLPVMRILIPDDARLIHVPDDARLILIPEGLK